MELTRGTKAEIDTKRVELIRDLCTGEGLTDDLFVSRAEDFKVFGDYDVETMKKLFSSTADMLPENPFTLALMNALEPSDDGKNLTERRLDYAEKHGTISSRTLIRHEQEGAELFVKFFDIAEGQYIRLKEEEESEDAARDADLEVMRRRLKKLEDALKTQPEPSVKREDNRELEELRERVAELEKAELRGQVAELESALAATNRRLDETIDALSNLSKDHGALLYRYESTETILRQQNILLNLSGS